MVHNSPHMPAARASEPAPPPRRWTAHLQVTRPAWWLWAALTVLLLAAAGGDIRLRYAAMALAAAQAVAWLTFHRSLLHFPTQVRLAYVVVMAASFLPGGAWLYWVQTTGTTALVVLGYCPLARLLLLLPINRSVPLTTRRVARILLHPPTRGSVLEELRL